MANKSRRNPPIEHAKGEPERRLLYGAIEHVDDLTISGWAVDLRQNGAAAPLILVIDGRPVQGFQCTEPRQDVNGMGLAGNKIGFSLALPEFVFDGALHKISIRFRSGESLPLLQDGQEVFEDIRFKIALTTVMGMVDGMFGSSIRGWVFRESTRSGDRTGGVSVEVRANGVKIDTIKAGLIRNDVAEAHGSEPHCGFLYAVPSRYRDGRPFVLEFHAVPEGVQLQGSPFSASTLIRDSADQLHGIHANVQMLCTQLYALKDQLRQMITADEHTLDIYSSWATPYFETLRARMVAERRSTQYKELLGDNGPKVSVICPTYKPNLAEFVAAIDSVRTQSWQNWELLIVDDGSGSAALTEVIQEVCAADPRIKAVPHAKNAGISAATNTAIAAATGDYVALFDHDDLLVDVALELMLLNARFTGAPVLYSDEDKIDNFGVLSEPHLKPDWNYRLALTNNYVCHLLMVETETLRRVGPLRAKYDGAQDHDLVLRLFEAVGFKGIHHVSEILYHWRKSANSTASQQSSKSYAVEAGRNALLDHMARRNLKATVSAPFNSTLYDVRYVFSEEPKVSILIPFKDQVEVTRKCVECLLSATEYSNYEIVLIDNWSTAPETAAWLETLASNQRISIIRIEERFNYSRINNMAAQQIETDYFLLLNNDIFVAQPDWLRIMVDEALADPKVGIVGARLQYPNGTIQHAGVILGVGGVADHSFRYYPPDAPGYSFRSICSQDLSAVTAACLLCRADAFRAVGMLDGEKLAVAFNDVDLCLKIGAAGYRIVYTSAVVVEHHESLSRGSDLAEHNLTRFYEENQLMMDRWGPLIDRDPFYNPHFSHETGMFEKLSSASLDLRRAPSLLRGERGSAKAEPLPAPPPRPDNANSSPPTAKKARRKLKQVA